MDFARQQRNPMKHWLGIGFVVALHGLLGWALATGLATKVVEVVRTPVETRLIEEIKPPPPPPPPAVPKPLPRLAPPSPAFVPPPEVVVSPPPVTSPAIVVATETPPVREPAAAEGTPAPAVAAPAPAPLVRTSPALDFNVCAKPEYNTVTRRAEVEGTVVVAYTMDIDGRITDAKIERTAGFSREHRMLDRLTLEAVQNCRGRPGTVNGKPERLTGQVTYVWKIVD